MYSLTAFMLLWNFNLQRINQNLFCKVLNKFYNAFMESRLDFVLKHDRFTWYFVHRLDHVIYHCSQLASSVYQQRLIKNGPKYYKIIRIYREELWWILYYVLLFEYIVCISHTSGKKCNLQTSIHCIFSLIIFFVPCIVNKSYHRNLSP